MDSLVAVDIRNWIFTYLGSAFDLLAPQPLTTLALKLASNSILHSTKAIETDLKSVNKELEQYTLSTQVCSANVSDCLLPVSLPQYQAHHLAPLHAFFACDCTFVRHTVGDPWIKSFVSMTIAMVIGKGSDECLMLCWFACLSFETYKAFYLQSGDGKSPEDIGVRGQAQSSMLLDDGEA